MHARKLTINKRPAVSNDNFLYNGNTKVSKWTKICKLIKKLNGQTKNKKPYQTCWGPPFIRLEAAIALRWLSTEPKFVASVTDKGLKSCPTSGKFWETGYFNDFSLIFASLLPIRRAAAPTSINPCVWRSWAFKGLSPCYNERQSRKFQAIKRNTKNYYWKVKIWTQISKWEVPFSNQIWWLVFSIARKSPWKEVRVNVLVTTTSIKPIKVWNFQQRL